MGARYTWSGPSASSSSRPFATYEYYLFAGRRESDYVVQGRATTDLVELYLLNVQQHLALCRAGHVGHILQAAMHSYMTDAWCFCRA